MSIYLLDDTLGAYVSSSSNVPLKAVPKDGSFSDPKRFPSAALEHAQSGLESSLLNLGGTTWDGTLTYSKNDAQVAIQIVFGHDGTALATCSKTGHLGFELTDHCGLAAPNGKTTLDCPFYTSGAWPDPVSAKFSVARVYVLSVDGSSMTGTADEANNANQHASVSLIRK